MGGAFDRAAILESFIKEVALYLPEIETNLERLQRRATDHDALEEIYRRAHTIAGAAAMMDLTGIARIASSAEQLLETVLDGPQSLDAASLALLGRSTARLRQMMELARIGADDSAIVAQDAADHLALRGGRPGMLAPGASAPSSPPSPRMAPPVPAPPVQSAWPAPPPDPRRSPNAFEAVELPTGPVPIVPRGTSPVPPAADAAPAWLAASPVTHLAETPLWQDVRGEEHTLQSVASALLASITQLRELGQIFDHERHELTLFLDGSNDALDRLEQWAGQQMGIDLRTSPDHVRRYLPLAVLWIVTARMKNVITTLQDLSRGLVVQNEALTESLGHLRTALEQVGQLGGAIAAAASALPEGGTLATVTSFAYMPPRGDQRLPNQAEIERQIRESLRRELEDEVRAEIAAEVRRDEERHIRQRLEIEIRRQILAEFTPASAQSTGGGGIDFSAMAAQREAQRRPRAVTVKPERSAEALEVFRTEAEEHLRTIANGVDRLEANPRDHEAILIVRRAVHTLKGAAAITGFSVVADLAHSCEDLLDRMSEQTLNPTPDVVSLILDTCQALESLVDDDTAEQGGERGILAALRPRYEAILGETLELSITPAPHPAVRPAGAVHVNVLRDQLDEELEGGSEQTPDRQPGAVSDLFVRLPLSKLDELINLFGDLLVNRSIVEERMGRMTRMVNENVALSDRLRDVGTRLERQFEAAMLPSRRQTPGPGAPNNGLFTGQRTLPPPSFGGVVSGPYAQPANTGEFDPLELDRYGEFHQLTRGLSEAVVDAGALNNDMEGAIRDMEVALARESRLSSLFQDALLKARLVPIASLIPRVYRTIQSVAVKYGKDIELLVEGDDTEVDRGVFEDLAAPLLHLARNAIYHGIELPATREAAGKPRRGHITLIARYEGNHIVLSIRDDGAGLNPEHIQSTALARGLVDAYTPLSPTELLNLIFLPGFSTSETVTEEGGRGVGLDVVRDTVTRLRGTITVDSSPGKGTSFTLKVPISLQIQRVVLVRISDQTYAIPMGEVEQLGQLDYFGRNRNTDQPAVEVRNVTYPLVHLAPYLNLVPGPVNDKSPVLLLRAGQRRWALLVDAIVGRQEIVAKNLGPHLRDIPSIAGATVLGNGQVLLILEPVEMLIHPPRSGAAMPTIPPPGTPIPANSPRPGTDPLAGMRPMGRPDQAGGPRPARPLTGDARSLPYILVVDDSPSVRRVVSNTLLEAGWEVLTARDGAEALDIVAKRVPASILLDIEMPRMDGYELIAAIRAQPSFAELPLVVLTSRAASKHQQRALSAGADAYVIKPYQDEQLLSTLQALVKVRPDGSPNV